MKKIILFLFIVMIAGCSNSFSWKNYDESIEIKESKDHSNTRMQFKLIQSKIEFNSAFSCF